MIKEQMTKVAPECRGHNLYRSIKAGGGIEMCWSNDGTVVELTIDQSKFPTAKWRITIDEAAELRQMLLDYIDP